VEGRRVRMNPSAFLKQVNAFNTLNSNYQDR